MILKTLSEAVGVSGDEGSVRAILIDAVRQHVDGIDVDEFIRRNADPI